MRHYLLILAAILTLVSSSYAVDVLDLDTTLNDLHGEIRDDDTTKEKIRRIRSLKDLAKGQLKSDPQSPFGHRTMGDVLHLLGHIAETRKQYDLAIRYHLQSIAHFQKSDLPSFTSPSGVIHGYEHAFQSLFDAGEFWFAKKEFTKAKEYFTQAKEFYKENRLGEIFLEQIENEGWGTRGSLRVKLRYPHLTTYLSHLKTNQLSCKFILK